MESHQSRQRYHSEYNQAESLKNHVGRSVGMSRDEQDAVRRNSYVSRARPPVLNPPNLNLTSQCHNDQGQLSQTGQYTYDSRSRVDNMTDDLAAVGFQNNIPRTLPESDVYPRQNFAYNIAGRDNPAGESLDPRYKVQRNTAGFFVVGRVFSMVWHENAGEHGTKITSRTEYTVGKFNSTIFSNIRRMVVVKAMDQCAWCIPINTYHGQGVSKSGVNVAKHAMVYMKGSSSVPPPGEPRMIKQPLEVEPASLDQKLHIMSRLNFGKVYTVEHNVRVLPVGKISANSLQRFKDYVRMELLSGL